MILILVFLFSFTASANQCWLTTETTQDGHLYADCRTGPSPYKRLCKIKRSPFMSNGIYDVLISTPPDDSFTGTIAEWLGLNSRPWTPSETLADNERIVCRVNADRVQAIRDARKAAEQAEQNAKAAEVDRLDKLDKAKRQYCQKASKNNLEKILCAEWKREAIEE
jgi:hypothetical protein